MASFVCAMGYEHIIGQQWWQCYLVTLMGIDSTSPFSGGERYVARYLISAGKIIRSDRGMPTG
jgi:hypothetical protein